MLWLAPTDSTVLDALIALAPDSSKNTLKSWVKQGRIEIQGRMVKDPSAKVKKGDKIFLGSKKQFINYSIEILYEDKHLVVVHKPEGPLSVGTDYSPYKNVHGFLKRRAKGRNVYPVHRLDRETSGVMMFAYTESAKDNLKKQFEIHSIQREYIAIVEGDVVEDKGTYKSFLVEDDTYFVKSTRTGGKEVLTQFFVEQRNKHNTMLRLKLETGKKNQIRVHCSEAGHPVVGDEKYGSVCLKAPRVYLHAAVLGFVHPETQKEVVFDRKPSPEFLSGMKQRKFVDHFAQLDN